MDIDPAPDFASPGLARPLLAEEFSANFLHSTQALSFKDVAQLADLLLCEAPDQDGRFLSGASVSAGLYHRHKIGLRKLCLSHPQSVRLLTSFIAFIAPDFCFSSLVLIDGIASPVHKDAANSNLPNVVIPLSSFSGAV